MYTVYDLIEETAQLIDKFIARCDVVTPLQLGLDVRCASTLYVTRDMIACRAEDDSNLQYYGGFEYIDSGSRLVFGDEYVMYLRTDGNRIDGILESYYEGNA